MKDHKSYWEYQENYNRFSRRKSRRNRWIKFILIWFLVAGGVAGVGILFYIPMKKAEETRNKAVLKSMVLGEAKLPEIMAKTETQNAVASNSLPAMKAAGVAIVKKDRFKAIAELKQVLAGTNVETRAQLLAWAALRDLGEKPPPRDAMTIHGVVLEWPLNDGVDMVTAYEDGRAYYFESTGRIIKWETPGDAITPICQRAILDAKPLISRAPLAKEHSTIASNACRITMLTFGGNRFVDCRADAPLPVVIDCLNLIKTLLKEERSKPLPPPPLPPPTNAPTT